MDKKWYFNKHSLALACVDPATNTVTHYVAKGFFWETYITDPLPEFLQPLDPLTVAERPRAWNSLDFRASKICENTVVDEKLTLPMYAASRIWHLQKALDSRHYKDMDNKEAATEELNETFNLLSKVYVGGAK